MGEDEIKDRRRFPRLNLQSEIVYTKYIKKEKEKSQTKNISKGGICFIAYEELKEGDLIYLNIYLPEDTMPVNTLAKVVWVKEFYLGESSARKFDIGVEFVNTKDKDREKIEKYIFNVLSKPEK